MKLRALGVQVQPLLKKYGFEVKPGKVSQHYPSTRNGYSVDGMWLAFAAASKRYYNWAQLNVGLYSDGLRIGIEVPRKSTDNPIARRLLSNSAELVSAPLNKLGRNGGAFFWPLEGNDEELFFPVQPASLSSVAAQSDHNTWISMGQWYKIRELPTNLSTRTAKVFRLLKPIFQMLANNTVDENTRVVNERMLRKQVLRAAKKFFTNGDQTETLNVWRKAKTIDWPIKTQQTIIRSTQARILAALTMVPRKIHGEIIQATPGLPIPKWSHVQKLKRTIQNFVRIMGGNPQTIRIMVTNSYSDGRTIEGQIFVNASLTDKNPIFWGIVAARELAGLTTKSYYPHIRHMSTLLEKLIANPNFLKSIPAK